MLDGPTLIMGRMLGSNPTHQLNPHFYHTFCWVQQVLTGNDADIMACCRHVLHCSLVMMASTARIF